MLLKAEKLSKLPRLVVLVAVLLPLGVLAAFVLPLGLKFALGEKVIGSGASSGNLPLYFEPSVGQADASARYVFRSGVGLISFSSGEIHLALPGTDIKEEDGTCDAPSRALIPTGLKLRFVGADKSVQPSDDQMLPGKMNDLLGSDAAQSQTNLPTYESIVYRGLYPGIDLIYSGANDQLKSTYIIVAGTDPSRIAWRYAGAEAVTIDAGGALQVSMNGGVVLAEEAPVAWQEIDGRRVSIDAHFAKANNGNISFTPGSYDPSHPLTIASTLTFLTYLGGSGD